MRWAFDLKKHAQRRVVSDRYALEMVSKFSAIGSVENNRQGLKWRSLICCSRKSYYRAYELLKNASRTVGKVTRYCKKKAQK